MEFTPFLPQGTKSRIRLSGGIFGSLEWPESEAKIDCIGFFRQEGELLCLPSVTLDDTGNHPFADALAAVNSSKEPGTVPSLGSIPRLRAILASERILYFQASWASANKSQLDINLGVEVTEKLGWKATPATSSPIQVGAFGKILFVVSDRLLQMERYAPLI